DMPRSAGIVRSDEPPSARTNPKRATGRLDIFTRVTTVHSHGYEDINHGYSGSLYLEVVPKSVPCRVRMGQRLKQLRIRHGHARLSHENILRTHQTDPLLYGEDGKPLSVDRLKVGNGPYMSVQLAAADRDIVGYKAKKNRDLIYLDRI